MLAVGVFIFWPREYSVQFTELRHREGKMWQLTIRELPSPCKWIFKIAGDSNSHPWASSLILMENGRELGPAHTTHQEIVSGGGGAYSHWGEAILFSTSNSSDPKLSDYTATAHLSVRNRVLVIYFAVLFCFIIPISIFLKKCGLRNIFCATLAFIFTLWILSEYIGDWYTSPDTSSYLGAGFKDPWNSGRTPGFAIYLEMLGVRGGIWDFMHAVPSAVEQNEIGKSIPEVDSLFKRVVWGNVLCLAFGFAILAFALSRFMPAELSAAFSCLCAAFGRLPSPDSILTEQPACFLAVLFVAAGLFFIQTRRLLFLSLLCLLAVFAMLVKPAMAFLPLVAGIIVMLHLVSLILHKEKRKAICTFVIGCLLSVGTLFWPLLLYVESGFFVASQLSGVSKIMFAVHLLRPGDEDMFEDPAHRDLVAELVRQKSEVDKYLDDKYFSEGREAYSQARIYVYSVNQYGYVFFPDVCRQNNIIYTNHLEYNRLAKDISGPIIKAHFEEYLKTVGRSFLSGFGYYRDLDNSLLQYVYFSGLRSHAFPIILGTFLIILLSLALGDKSLRLPIAMAAAIHPLSVLIHSIGHAVLARYVEMTEWSLLLALLLALYSLFVRIVANIRSWSGGIPRLPTSAFPGG